MTPPIIAPYLWSDVGVQYSPTFSGGNWSETLPLANLQDRRLQRVARSTSAGTEHTVFEIDLGRERPCRVFFTGGDNVFLNLTRDARIRYRLSNTQGSYGMPLYDSDWLDYWPDNIDAEQSHGINVHSFHIAPTAQAARHCLVEIDDASNPDGYVQIGRTVIAGTADLSDVGIRVGAKFGVESDTQRITTSGGSFLYNVEPGRRTQNIVIPHVKRNEAFLGLLRLQMQRGMHGQLLWIPDPDDDTTLWLTALLCTARETVALDWDVYDALSATLALVEEL